MRQSEDVRELALQWQAYLRLVDRGQWEKAASALKEMQKAGLSDAADHWEELLGSAADASEAQFVRRYLEQVVDPDRRRLLRLRLDVQESPGVLDDLEVAIQRGLAGEQDDLYGLAFSLLEHRPALGILVARSVLDPQHAIDSRELLDEVEVARERLGLPPGDVFAHFYDVLRFETTGVTREQEDAKREQVMETIARLAVDARA